MTDRGTYIKMSDSLPEHRKIVAAGGDAGWLHICALAYASRNRTDGFLPAAYVPQLSDRKQPAKLAARLCEVNLWHAPGHDCKKCPQPQSGEYVIHDYLEHQRSAAKIAEVSEKRATAGRTGGSRSKPKAKQIASGLLEPGFAGAEAKPTPDTEGSLREPQAEAEVPATPGAGAPNPAPVVAAFTEGAKAAGLKRPDASIVARVGKQARQMLAEGTYTLEELIRSARTMGAGEWNDLAVQVRKDNAAANGRGSVTGHQAFTNPTDASAYEGTF